MTWTGQAFSVGQELTAAQMTNLQADITAQANGDGGAPKQQLAGMASGAVDQVVLAANSVGQSEIKTAYQQLDGGGSGAVVEYIATGGFYTLGVTMQERSNGMTEATHGVVPSSATTSYAAKWRIQWPGSNTYDGLRLYYINSSPPYDLGDGEIPLFVYAIVENATQNILDISASPDPIWAYNGPTNIIPSR